MAGPEREIRTERIEHARTQIGALAQDLDEIRLERRLGEDAACAALARMRAQLGQMPRSGRALGIDRYGSGRRQAEAPLEILVGVVVDEERHAPKGPQLPPQSIGDLKD